MRKNANQCRMLLLASFFSLLTVQPLHSQQINLSGMITDNGAEYLGSGAEPVAGALVTFTELSSGESQTVYTDEDGYYSFEITLTGIHEDDFAQPSAFKVLQNYPNPFNPSTVIPFQIQRPAHITLDVYNVLGRKVRTLIDGYQSSSGYVVWDAADDLGRGVPAGVYVYTLKAEDVRSSRKMLLLDGHQASPSAAVSAFEAPVSPAAPVTWKAASAHFTLTVEGEDIEVYEQDIEITGDMTVDVTAYRTMTGNNGRVYRLVKINDQWWTAENLRETRYRNRDIIKYVTDDSEWINLAEGGRCIVNINYIEHDIYGYLYNWHAVSDSRKITPEGWRVPKREDWAALFEYLGGKETAGGKMKMEGTDYWIGPNEGATNESGFSALPGGYRYYASGSYHNPTISSYFWSQTERSMNTSWYLGLSWNSPSVDFDSMKKNSGYYVRLVRDYVTIITEHLPDAGRGLSYSTVLEASDGTEPYFWSVLSGSFPAGLMLDSVTGEISGVPEASGIFEFTVQIKENTGFTDTKQFMITVLPFGEIGTMTGNDGRVYRTIKIEDQWWMMENLMETQYRNGDEITVVADNIEWVELRTGARCVYDDDESNAATYGFLYNWYAVNDERNIAPENWRVPLDDDWKELEVYLGMSPSDADLTGNRGETEGGKLKATGLLGKNNGLWARDNFGATNETGFSALPGGARRNSDGAYFAVNWSAYFWTSSKNGDSPFRRLLSCSNSMIWRSTSSEISGLSVRLVYSGIRIFTRIMPDGITGFSYDQPLNVMGGKKPYLFSVVSGSLPDGLTLDSATGGVSGLPGISGIFDFTIEVEDAAGEVYQRDFTIKIFGSGTMTGNDGRVYSIINIGGQWWMMENLQETRYRNGDEIPIVEGKGEWENQTAGARCVYNNDKNNADIYGYLYNWNAADDERKIAPEGWRVPTDDDWKELEMYLGMSSADADKMFYRGAPAGSKLAGNLDLWLQGDLAGHDEFGSSSFFALPAGVRYSNGSFNNVGSIAGFWSASEYYLNSVWGRILHHQYSDVNRRFYDKNYGFSIRLIME